MREAFKKGQKKLSSKQLNYMLDASNAVHDSFLHREGVPILGTTLPPFLVNVKNVSGESLWSYSVLAITTVTISEDEAEARSDALNANVVLEGDTPDGEDDIVAITLSPVNQDEMVYAVLLFCFLQRGKKSISLAQIIILTIRYFL